MKLGSTLSIHTHTHTHTFFFKVQGNITRAHQEMRFFLSCLFYSSSLFLYYYYNDTSIKCLQLGLNVI